MANLENKEKIIDEASMSVFQKSLPSCGETFHQGQLTSEYQNRYKEYEALLKSFFNKNGEVNNDVCTSLLMHFYERTMNQTARGSMIQILSAVPLIEQYVLDNIDFVRKKI